MKIYTVLLTAVALGFAGGTYAQKPMTFSTNIVLTENAIEAYRVIPVVTADNTVIEVRVFECEKCKVKTYPPEPSIEFFSGKERVEATAAADISKGHDAVVFIDINSEKIRSVKYFVAPASGESL